MKAEQWRTRDVIRLRDATLHRALGVSHPMPVWPKRTYSFGLSLRTAATEWKLRKKLAAAPAQRRILNALLPQLAATSVWRATGVEPGMSYELFRERVPLHSYEDVAPAIQRMIGGEENVLWPGRCSLFALTAGTTNGNPRAVPMTEHMLSTVRRAGRDALLYYTVRMRHAAVFGGRHLFFGGSTALQPLHEGADPSYGGELSGIAALTLPAWVEKHLYEPGAQIAQTLDWQARVDAVIHRTHHRDISLLAGLPNWTLLLAMALRENCSSENHPVTNLQSVWPNLECYVHTGVPIAPFFEQLREVLGPTVKFHEVYAATEAIIAAQDGEPMQGMRIMADAGTFFEFLPLPEFDPNRLDQLGTRTVPLAEVKRHVDYVVVLTNATGLARYVLGDVVRFASVDPHRLHYIGRTTLRLDSVGERIMEKDLTDALVSVCRRRDWTIVNFHVAPFAASGSRALPQRVRHEWWIELRPGTMTTPTGPQIAAELDRELKQLSETYALKRDSGTLDAPVVRLVMPGVFEHLMRFQNAWGGQHQMPRCRPDRRVADELSQITNFAHD